MIRARSNYSLKSLPAATRQERERLLTEASQETGIPVSHLMIGRKNRVLRVVVCRPYGQRCKGQIVKEW